jgi:hypothetical protein
MTASIANLLKIDSERVGTWRLAARISHIFDDGAVPFFIVNPSGEEIERAVVLIRSNNSLAILMFKKMIPYEKLLMAVPCGPNDLVYVVTINP